VLALPVAIFYVIGVKKSKKDILQYFSKDTLTGLSNRNTLIKELHDTTPYALMLINLDAFKELNDFYGHETGDKVLYEVSRRLDNFIAKSGSKMTSGAKLFRLHSDEFAVLFESRLNKEGLAFVAEVILLHLSSVPIGVDSHDVAVNATIGIALQEDDDGLIYDEDIKDAKYFMTSANIALKQAKLMRRPYLFYDSTMLIEQKYEQNITWIKKLKDAIKDDALVPFYQPILNNQTGEVEKYESLIRLIDDKGFAVSPYHFLDVAKKSRLYDKITKTVIDKSFEMFKDKESSFSVNLSILDIQNKDIVAFIFKRLEEVDVGDRVVFEILESEGIENYDELYSFRERIRLFGSKISIDDFGAGYSNFDHILKLKPDFIKIDGSLIKNIDKDDSARILTKAIVGFAKELGSKTIAEFVHSKEVFEAVCTLGIDYSQGYFISEPKPHPSQTIAAKPPFDTISTAQ
jgi:c-di-GMP phosphodiesterase